MVKYITHITHVFALVSYLDQDMSFVLALAPVLALSMASVVLVHVLGGPRVWCLALTFLEPAPRLGCQPRVVSVLLGE